MKNSISYITDLETKVVVLLPIFQEIVIIYIEFYFYNK
jgi:hypothetical protein